jgi:AcrR family transcriptional regulator
MANKKVRREKSENVEQMILNVAEDVFLEKGYAMTSTTEIAKRVGCNQALIHYYFRTKERLFEKLFEKKFVSFISAVVLSKERSANFRDVVRSIIESHAEIISQNPRLPFLIINEMTTNPVRFRVIAEKIKDTVGSLLSGIDTELKKEIAAGRVREISAFDLFLNILSLNLFVYIAQPLISHVRDYSFEEFVKFTRKRKEEVFLTVWGGICIKENIL